MDALLTRIEGLKLALLQGTPIIGDEDLVRADLASKPLEEPLSIYLTRNWGSPE